MSRSLLKLMSIESAILSNHPTLCRPLLLLPSVFPSIRVFSNELALRIRWPKLYVHTKTNTWTFISVVFKIANIWKQPSEEELKSLLMKVKVESEKVGLKLNIQKMKIMTSGPITSWKIDGETVETVSDSILGGSKITADGDCSHEIKRRFLLGRKVMTNLDSILKSRDITLPTKVV